MQSASHRLSTYSPGVGVSSSSPLPGKIRVRKDGTTGNEALEEKVADLTAKINELTILIMAQQREGEP
jgi:hypothetical protein